jgi:hypothetical protein
MFLKENYCVSTMERMRTNGPAWEIIHLERMSENRQINHMATCSILLFVYYNSLSLWFIVVVPRQQEYH